MRPAIDRLKWRQLAHETVERRQTQHTAVSAWGDPQWGQRHVAMSRF
jgi:hypothetical protein